MCDLMPLWQKAHTTAYQRTRHGRETERERRVRENRKQKSEGEEARANEDKVDRNVMVL